MAVTGTAVNVWASRIIPAVLLGIIGYVSWVITRPVAGEDIDFSTPNAHY